jgi:hypothetical protein
MFPMVLWMVLGIVTMERIKLKLNKHYSNMELTTNKKEINKGIIVGVLIFLLFSILTFDLFLSKLGFNNKLNMSFYSIFFSTVLTKWIGSWVFEKSKLSKFKPILFGLTMFSIFFFIFYLVHFVYYSKG